MKKVNFDARFEALNNFVEATETVAELLGDSLSESFDDVETIIKNFRHAVTTTVNVRVDLRYKEEENAELDENRLIDALDCVVDNYHILAGKNPGIRNIAAIKQKDFVATLKNSVDAKTARAIFKAYKAVFETYDVLFNEYRKVA